MALDLNGYFRGLSPDTFGFIAMNKIAVKLELPQHIYKRFTSTLTISCGMKIIQSHLLTLVSWSGLCLCINTSPALHVSLKPLCVSPLTGSRSCLCLWPAALCHRRHVWCGVSGTSFTVMVLVINLNFTKIPFILTWSCISHLKSPLRWILDNLIIIISISMFMTSLCAGIHDVLSASYLLITAGDRE